MYEPLVRYHQWLYTDRDPHGEGLVLLVHPWETGLDNSPPWMHSLHDHQLPNWIRLIDVLHLDKVINLFRRDTRSVPLDQRFSTIEVLALFNEQLRMRRKAYDIDRILDHGLFAIEDLSYNCILIRANHHLQQIADNLKETLPAGLQTSMPKTEHALDALWDEYQRQYFSRDFITHNLIKVPSIATLLPLYAGTIDQARAAKLVAMIENEKLFGATWPLPSVPLNAADFHPKLYWQGPTWINMNWLIIDGLKRYGYDDHAAALRESTLEMVSNSGFYEYFNPLDGTPAGGPNFSWTAALVLDLINQK